MIYSTTLWNLYNQIAITQPQKSKKMVKFNYQISFKNSSSINKSIKKNKLINHTLVT